MRNFQSLVLCVGAAAVLAACGGGGSGGKVIYSGMVNFGDSLSDVGTYKVGTVAALGGGMYNVNSSTAKNWTQVLAPQLGVSTPCPYQTGLDGSAAQGFSVPVAYNIACKNYAQGGSRVTNPVGPGNKLLGGANAILGQTTVPLVAQVANHLGVVGGKFSGVELVTVMAGGNDAIIQTATYTGTVAAAAAAGGAAAAASAGPTAASAAVTAMATAGTELATLVKDQMVAKGAKYVVVVNLPNVSATPYGALNEAGLPGTKAVIDTMVKAFNTALSDGLANNANVRIVDAYASSSDQSINPAQYGLSNVTATACNLASPTPNALGSSLVCNTSNVIAGDVSKYLFADAVHPTPYGYELLSQAVSKAMLAAGWL
jgi:outer membrane lipase/esterase